MSLDNRLIRVQDLTKVFSVRAEDGKAAEFTAVDSVSFSIIRGQTFGLIGESGSGKTTTGRMVMGLEKPTSGSVTFNGNELVGLSDLNMRRYRQQIQIVFQDSGSAFNPRAQRRGADLLSAQAVPHRVAYRGEEEDARPPRPRRHAAVALRPLYPRVLGWPTPTPRHRPSLGDRPGLHRPRRTDRSTGCVGAGTDPQPAEGPPARTRVDDAVDHPQPRARRAHVRTRRSARSRQARRSGIGGSTAHRTDRPTSPANSSTPCSNPTWLLPTVKERP